MLSHTLEAGFSTFQMVTPRLGEVGRLPKSHHESAAETG